MIDPHIEGMCKISESGGRQRSKIWIVAPHKGIKIALCEDSFGDIIEIYDHCYD